MAPDRFGGFARSSRAPEFARGANKQQGSSTMEAAADQVKEFAKNSVRLVKRCQKPDRKEFTKVARLTAMGFLAVGLIGFLVKVIFIPINQIIIGTTTSS